MAADALLVAAQPYMAAIASPGTSESEVVRNMLSLNELMARPALSAEEFHRRREQDNRTVLSAVRAAGPTGRTGDGLRAWDLIPQAVELTMDQRALLDASARGVVPL